MTAKPPEQDSIFFMGVLLSDCFLQLHDLEFISIPLCPIVKPRGKAGMKITFKEEKNVDTILELSRFVHEIHQRNHPDVFEKYDRDSFKKSLDEYLGHDLTKVIVACDDDAPVGYAVFCERKYQGHIFRKGHCSIYIDQMGVKPEYRSRGVGKMLVEKIKQYCRENGVKRIELSVWSDNERAKAFYGEMGFEVYLENMKMNL